MTSAAWAAAGPAPPAARVPHNEWTRLTPPPLGGWQPDQLVSVVIPAYQAHEPLRLCLAALAAQTYPRERLEVIVADDGSDPPVEREDDWPELDITVVRQPHDGFGAGRARNLGAAAANGDILLFLDADMVLEPRAVEAHARWHHVSADAATLGMRRHADLTGVTPTDVVAAAATDWQRLLDERERWDVEWISRFLERTGQLTSRRDDLFRVIASGNLGIRADLFREVGGFHAFGIRGIEDTEFGYRLYTNGALLVPDEHTLGWHQGRSFFQGPGGAKAKDARRSKTANYIPLEGFRDAAPGRSYPVPRVFVRVPWGDEPLEQVADVAGSVLAGRWHDVVVGVEARPGRTADTDESVDAGLAELADHFDGDQRVRVTSEPAAVFQPSPVQVTLPPAAVLGPESILHVWQELVREPLGVLHLTVPGSQSGEQVVRAVRTRALCRATRVAASTGEPVDRVLAELFGERRTGGEAFGIRPYASSAGTPTGPPAQPQPEARAGGSGGSPAPVSQAGQDRALRDRLERAETRLAELRSQVSALRSRRAVRVADAVGGLRRAPTFGERRVALRRLVRAVRGR